MQRIALIVAAGSGSRTGGEIPKQYQEFNGKPLLRHTLDLFLAHPEVDGVQVVIAPEHRDLYEAATKGLALLPPALGGATRQDSVLAGLEALEAHKPQIVLIHDAARPFTRREDISRLIVKLRDVAAALLAIRATDTLKEVEESTVTRTPERSRFWQAQTPQGFHFQPILAAHRHCKGQNLSDDAAVAEAAGLAVEVVEGSRHNWKITMAEDFSIPSLPVTRTAMGFDLHRFIPSPTGKIRLGGVDIPHDKMLEGHSDADVILHAITDALLGTIADGDIGVHFSPHDARWKGMDSTHFLRHAMEKVMYGGGRLVHIDVTVIGEEPKIAPHRDAIRASIAQSLAIPLSAISIKATTTEGLQKEALAAMAVVNVTFPA